MKYGDNITQNVHGCQETNEPEKLYYETQNDNGDGSWGNKEGTARKRSHLEEREEDELEYSGTIRDGEKKPDAALTTEKETEIHQQRNQIHKLKEKIESTYYQVTNRNWQETKITKTPKYV